MHKVMKQFSIRRLRLLLFLGIALTAISSEALRIDNTHYRFCVMDNAVITNYSGLSASNSGVLSALHESTWYSYYGIKINGYQTKLETSNDFLSVQVLISACKQIIGRIHTCVFKMRPGQNKLRPFLFD